MSGLLFITAPNADHEAINKILLRLQYCGDDSFKLLTSKTIDALRSDSTATSPPVPEKVENAWKDASLEEIEEFLFDLELKCPDTMFPEMSMHLYVVVDEEGLKSETCVLAERVLELEGETVTYPRVFNRSRVPWDETYDSWCNLYIANVGWEEMMEPEEDEKKGGWWTYALTDGEEGAISGGESEVRDAAFEKLEKEGKL